MELQFLNNNNYTFTSRCPEIRDAEWVCHTINCTIPYFSTSKFKPAFEKFLRKIDKKCAKEKSPMDMSILKINLAGAILDIGNEKNKIFKNFILKLTRKFTKKPDKSQDKDLKLLTAAFNKIRELGKKRAQCIANNKDNAVSAAFEILSKFKMGNCEEVAIIAEIILKLNGIKNGATLFLKNENNLTEHVVCAFNRDGSPISKLSNNNTIIIDPWVGKADFAGNMLKYYQNILGNNFILTTKINDLVEKRFFATSPNIDYIKIKEFFPQFIFHSINRPFMQNSITKKRP